MLTPEATHPLPGVVGWSDKVLTEVSTGEGDGGQTTLATVDASDCWVLPGIVDLHGDAFERCLMPRGGVHFDTDLALQENDGHLLANGITTSFLSATDSWEPGLRSRSTLRALVKALARRRGGNTVLLHVRHERCNTEDHDELLEWISGGVIAFLSYNDHAPGGIAHLKGLTPSQIDRSGVPRCELERLQADAIDRRSLGVQQEDELAEAAAAVGCRLASHDPSSNTDLQRDRRLGVAVAEFPQSIELALAYLAEGIDVLLGAPNAVRGGSHLGHLSVRDALCHGAGTLLCSDYHYPSLLQAPFVLIDEGVSEPGQAWGMVSTAAARAAGLQDRGRLEVGARADVVVIEPPRDGRPARVRAVVAGGALAYGW